MRPRCCRRVRALTALPVSLPDFASTRPLIRRASGPALEDELFVHLVVVHVGIRAFELDSRTMTACGTVPEALMDRARVHDLARDQCRGARGSVGAKASPRRACRQPSPASRRRRDRWTASDRRRARAWREAMEARRHPTGSCCAFRGVPPRAASRRHSWEQIGLRKARAPAQARALPLALVVRDPARGIEGGGDAVIVRAVALHAHEHAIRARARERAGAMPTRSAPSLTNGEPNGLSRPTVNPYISRPSMSCSNCSR